MLPEKRRAGRAIRKARRERREAYERYTRAFNQLRVAVERVFPIAVERVTEALAQFVTAMRTPPRRNLYALTPSQGAAERSEAGSGDPSHSGGQRGREAHSAPRGPDVMHGVYDEPLSFWEDDDGDR